MQFQTPSIVDSTSDKVSGVLGITPERLAVIKSQIESVSARIVADHKPDYGTTNFLVECSSIATNANEVLYIGFAAQQFLDKLMNPEQMLKEMLKGHKSNVKVIII